ncbi:MAG: dihydrofolate reductase [Chitinophagales bacterium]|nr:dihydrofolate reductase [Chitinophagales bacterium]
MKIALIVAAAENGAIGKDNQLLWHLSDDLKRFKQLTSGHCILMGRKTYESIGKALPNRTNIILSNTLKEAPKDCVLFNDLEAALYYAVEQKEETLYVIGGATIYTLTMPYCTDLHLTLVHTEIEADAFFEFDDAQWIVQEKIFVAKDAKNEYDSTYLHLVRK